MNLTNELIKLWIIFGKVSNFHNSNSQLGNSNPPNNVDNFLNFTDFQGKYEERKGRFLSNMNRRPETNQLLNSLQNGGIGVIALLSSRPDFRKRDPEKKRRVYGCCVNFSG